MAKHGYKLQEFVAHSGNVNCLRIGKKACRLLLTGGDDHKANLWSIGKPTSLMSLCGHTTPVESLAFDSTEVLVLGGAASGTVKLWDLQEAKMVRTLTGHRSNCTSVEFHPFGEFFASGSADTDLKIWDIRKKGCIHTYKGHNLGINTIKFTPDGRWVVSGGFDNVVKVWDLTAGKLLHDLKFHNGHIRSLDFHPQEFLLATGSADRTVKFWDLETFEMIGSANAEATGVRAMTFHPDGRTLFCGYDNNLKVYSWEPVLCHDAVDMGWSTFGDLCIKEGNLIGCSYYRNSIGVWVADLSCVKPYGTRDSCSPQDSSAVKLKFDIQGSQSAEKVGQAADSPSVSRSTSPHTDATEIKNIYVDYEKPIRSRRTGLANRSKTVSSPPHTRETSKASAGKQSTPIATSGKPNGPPGGRSFYVPSFIPRESSSGKSSANLRRESLTPATARAGTGGSVKATNTSSKSNSRFDVHVADQKSSDRPLADVGFKDLVEDACPTLEKVEDVQEKPSPVLSSNLQTRNNPLDHKEIPTVKVINGAVAHGRTRSLVEKFEKVRLSSSSEDPMVSATPEVVADGLQSSTMEEEPQVSGRKMTSVSDTNVIEDLMQNHDVLLSGLRSRLTKLQMIRHLWERNDVKGAITALRKLPDQSVHADVISVLTEKMEMITLDLFSCMLPILVGLLDSKMERHAKLSMEMLLKQVALFGPTISSTISTPPSAGVDLHQEERIERSKQCFSQLHQIRGFLPALARRGGSLAKSALELNLVLQDHNM
ncbi:katanin p80 WD40 repeat-containing subunit B1 homolog KTN80.1-like isoform X2 [Silene latifolia]|uniref:katanin p80 WD40 repeat-containing subunit B1 homolog KTN80.1-like isoform X2 n=1 Tax=Silene latifolia TaxID=37657 RepID=UPI003D76BBFE